MGRMNVQAEVRKRLEAALGGVAVRTSVPDPRPAELVVVRREGGRRQDALVDAPGIGVDVWARTEARACEIAHAAADAMEALPFADGFASVSEEVVASQYDRLARSPHWYLSYTLKTYETNR